MLNPAELVAANTASPTVTAAVAPVLNVAEPITLAQAKDHLRVVGTDEDAYISSLILAARQMAEGRLNRTIVQRQRVAYFARWGCEIALRKPPILSVDAISYVDAAGTQVQMAADQYFLLNEEDDFARLTLATPPYTLPPPPRGKQDAITVTYTAGYEVGKVPQPIIQWMLLAMGTMYDNRESVVTGATSVALADDFAKWLLQPYMVYE